MMKHVLTRARFITQLLPSFLLFAAATTVQAQPPVGAPLGTGPWVFDTFEQEHVGVSVVARTLDHPFGLVFLPGTTSKANPLGDLLISERTGKVRFLKNGQLQTDIVADLSNVLPMEQLFDLKLHPQYTKNQWVYFTYIKTGPNPNGSKDYWVTTALARGRFDGQHLVDVKDVYVADAWSSNIGGASSRLQFLADGTLLLGVSHRIDTIAPQKLDNHIGKILRLNDDGTTPTDNPFIGVEGARPEIYTWGNRSVMDFTTHPVTGAVWEVENGPQGGDEVNILKPGANFGWPIATYGRDYDGKRFSPQPWVEGTDLPEVFWVPSITVASLHFYTGDKFPKWKNNLLVGSMIVGRIPGTGHVERVVFNEEGEVRREELFKSLKQRIRYIAQGPDDLIYLLTDDADGALLRLEPLSTEAAATIISTITSTTAATATIAPTAAEEPALFPGTDCAACHRTTLNVVGPSFTNIAKRYDTTNAIVALLADRIIKGGSGQWGDAPMSPHPDLTADTAKAMARTILALDAQ
jgi:aldose sugar dehydrogenase